MHQLVSRGWGEGVVQTSSFDGIVNTHLQALADRGHGAWLPSPPLLPSFGGVMHSYRLR